MSQVIYGNGFVEALIALVIVVTICILTLTGRSVPEILSMSFTLILGFYYGKQKGIEHEQTRQSLDQ